uniref:Uncharacterized protein n=1 Tax=Glossina morsitans morsitans TaxID=37546 RepID=A0A1B0G7G2_GLOMM
MCMHFNIATIDASMKCEIIIKCKGEETLTTTKVYIYILLLHFCCCSS